MMTPPPPRPQRVVEAEEEARKPGKAIRRGHRSYGLMLNLQLGIRQINALLFRTTSP
jgi:1-phosphatidylinositol-4-phosphate 5-kinase